MNRLNETLDAALNLLDRQVVDCEGLMVCKVDDVEVSLHPGGNWTVTGLLAGSSALVPRFSGSSGKGLWRHWKWLGVEQRDHDRPWRLPLSAVDHLDSAVHLSVRRRRALQRQGEPLGGSSVRRLDEVLNLTVTRDGTEVGHVLDVRVEPRGDALRCVSLVVGRGRPGSMLGYDRKEDMGPALLRKAIRWVHRHTVLVDLDDVVAVDWDARTIEVSVRPRELSGA